MKQSDKIKDDPHRQIIPLAEDQEMFTWLEDLFNLSPRTVEPGVPKSEPDSFPERITLRPVFGHGGRDMGNPIKTEEWKPMQAPQPGREQLVMLANKFLGLAQRECNVLGKQQRYGLFAYSTIKAAKAYEQYLFVLVPTAKEYNGENKAPATDDDDTHRDRLLSSSLAHSRWQQEQFSEAISGVMMLQQDIIKQQAETIARQDAERRAWILASEEALSKKQEREIAAKWSEAKINALGDMWQSVKGLLPAIAIHLSKGKVGIVEGLKSFLDGLTDETKEALFGKWNDRGELESQGIFDKAQCDLLIGIVDGKTDPARINELVIGLRPEQLMAAQNVLSPSQIQSLVALAKAASTTENQNNGN